MRIEEALREATDTRRVVVGRGVLEQVGEVLRGCFCSPAAVVVADENTLRAVAGSVPAQESFVFAGSPVLHCDYERVEEVREWLRGRRDAVPVAVGSGTINDIVKRAAHELGRPYASVATAASVDGFAAFGAAVTREGFKRTMECPAPRVVVADLDVLARAPRGMTASGYGDLLAKVCSGADWICADVLEVEPIEPGPWSLVQGGLREAVARPREACAGELDALAGLFEALVTSGLAMQAAGSSRPASGAEHQFSHLWEMEGLPEEVSHGFKVAIGTLASAALYERLLARESFELPRWPGWEDLEGAIRESLGPSLAEPAVEESRAKYVEAGELAARVRRLNERWPELRRRLSEQLLPAVELRDRLRAAGCPTSPEEIGLDRQRLRDSYRRAQMIRRRFTVLDLAHQTGLLDELVGELFAPGGFWG